MISVLHVDDERVVLDTSKLVLERSGKFSVEDCFRIHAETIERVYGVSIQLS